MFTGLGTGVLSSNRLCYGVHNSVLCLGLYKIKELMAEIDIFFRDQVSYIYIYIYSPSSD